MKGRLGRISIPLNAQARDGERRFHCILFNVDRIITVEQYGKLIINSSVCTDTVCIKYKHSFAHLEWEYRGERKRCIEWSKKMQMGEKNKAKASTKYSQRAQ